jgi:hypothetical protein
MRRLLRPPPRTYHGLLGSALRTLHAFSAAGVLEAEAPGEVHLKRRLLVPQPPGKDVPSRCTLRREQSRGDRGLWDRPVRWLESP